MSTPPLDLDERIHRIETCLRYRFINRDHIIEAFQTAGLSSQGRIASDGVMATTVEAILGAVYLDTSKNIEATKEAVLAFLG